MVVGKTWFDESQKQFWDPYGAKVSEKRVLDGKEHPHSHVFLFINFDFMVAQIKDNAT